MNSIRTHLLLWLLAGLLVADLGAVVATYFTVQKEVDELSDHQLRRFATYLHQQVPLEGHSLDLPERDAEDDFIIQVWKLNGSLLYASAPHHLLGFPSHPGFATLYRRGRPWRVFTVRKGEHLFLVGQRLSERYELSAGIVLGNLLPLLGLIPVLAVLIWVAVGRGLLPLEHMAESLDARRPDSLEPLPEGQLPREVRPLVNALNDLLKRLALALETQRCFVSDAAHELRTPLTAVHLQVQLLERATSEEERSAVLTQLRGGLDRAAHLVQQLLTTARLDPEAVERPFHRVRLQEVVREVMSEFSSQARHKGIDLGLPGAEPAEVLGDEEGLRILLGNLVDNALRYTPHGGGVQVRLSVDGPFAALEVEDDGPGIPPGERSRVFDRFYRRAGTGVPGSGLGLAIVKAIAERHQARVILDEGRSGQGLRVSVRFHRMMG